MKLKNIIAPHWSSRLWLPLLLGLSPALQAQSLVFEESQTCPAESVPFMVTIGTFNDDAIPDFAIANAVGDSVSTFLGNGDGTFQAQVVYPVGDEPYNLTSGDLNEDGYSDLVVANRFSPNISILFSNGDGTFQPQQTIPAGYQNDNVVVHDLNDDGHLDIVIAIHGNSLVEILLGDGHGNFEEVTPRISVGSGPWGLAVADVNSDGKPDILTGNWWGYNVTVLLGNGDGTFVKLPQQPGIGHRCSSIIVADFDEDGKPDVAAANSIDRSLSLLFGNGDGTFQTQQVIPLGFASYQLTSTDVDADGHTDLLLADAQFHTVRIMLGNGDGSFQTALSFAAGSGCRAVEYADLNTDGHLDLVTANYADNNAIVLLQIPPNRPPVADAGADVPNAECLGTLTPVQLDGSQSYDPDDDLLNYEWTIATGSGAHLDDPTSPTPLGYFPIGPTLVTLTVTDGKGGVALDDVLVTVVDTTPPILICTTDKIALWPPNHQMEEVNIFLNVSDVVSLPEDVTLICTVSSSEPDDAMGDGTTVGDVSGEDGFIAPVPIALTYDPSSGCYTGKVSLRAERDGSENGRSYSVLCQVADEAGNLNTASCVIMVPHDRRKK